MAVLQGTGSVLGKMIRPANQQQNQSQQLQSPDVMQQLMANQKAGIKLGGGSRGSSSGYAPSTRQSKFESELSSSPTTFEVADATRYLETADGKPTNLDALEAKGYVIPKEAQTGPSTHEPYGEAITRNGQVVNLDRDNVLEFVATDADGKQITVKSYGYKQKNEYFSDKESLMREAAVDIATRSGFSVEEAETWFTKNYALYTDLAKGGESHTWRALLNNVQVKDINSGTLSRFYDQADAGDYQPYEANESLITSYQDAYTSPFTVGTGNVTKGTGRETQAKISDKVNLEDITSFGSEEKLDMSASSVVRKTSGGLKGTDNFIITENMGESVKGVTSVPLLDSMVKYKDSEGGAVFGTAFNMSETYMYLNSKGINAPLSTTDTGDGQMALDTLTSLGVISPIDDSAMTSKEQRALYTGAVTFLNKNIIEKNNEYAKGLTEVEKMTLQRFYNSPEARNMRSKYANLVAQKRLVLDDFLTTNETGRQLMQNSNGIFTDDEIQTLEGEQPFSPTSPGAIDSLVDTLASMGSRDERQRFITRHFKGKLTPKGERWMNQLNNNLSLVTKRLDGHIDKLGDVMGRTRQARPLTSGPTFGDRVSTFFTDNDRDVSYSKSGWIGNQETNDYNLVTGLDALHEHWATIESLNNRKNNIEVSKEEFIGTVVQKAVTNEKYRKILQERIGLNERQMESLLDLVPDLSPFALKRELENIIDLKEQPIQDEVKAQDERRQRENIQGGKLGGDVGTSGFKFGDLFPYTSSGDKNRAAKLMPSILQTEE